MATGGIPDHDLDSCPVCFERFKEEGDLLPRLLPCTHTLCESCIKQLIRNNKLQCPECRVDHEALKHEKSFPQNKYLMRELSRSSTPSSDKTNTGFEKCEMHDQDFIFFCCEEGCQTPICRTCLMNEHRSHDFIEIERAQVQPFLREVRTLRENLQIKMSTISDTKKKIEGETEKCLVALEEKKEKIIAAFAEMMTEVVDQQHNNAVEDELATLGVNIDTLMNIEKNIGKAQIIERKEMKRYFKTLQAIKRYDKENLLDTKTYTFPVYENKETINIGRIHHRKTNVALQGDVSTAFKSTAPRSITMTHVGTWNTNLAQRTRFAVMERGELVLMGKCVGDKLWDLYIFREVDTSLGFIRKKLAAPCQHAHQLYFLSVVSAGREHLVISCFLCEKITLVNMQTAEAIVAFSGYRIVSMCCGEIEKIFVKCEDSKIIEVDTSTCPFERTGKEIDSFCPVAKYCGTTYLSSPYKCIVVAGERVARAISVETKQILWEINGDIEHQSLFPRAIMYLPRLDCLLLPDLYNSRILVFDPKDGRHIQTIPVVDCGDDYLIKLGYCRGQLVLLHDPRSPEFGGSRVSFYSLD